MRLLGWFFEESCLMTKSSLALRLPSIYLDHFSLTHTLLSLSFSVFHTHTHTHTQSLKLSQTHAHGICLKLTVRCSAYQNQNFRRENFNSALSLCFIESPLSFDRRDVKFWSTSGIEIHRTLGGLKRTSRHCKLHSIFLEVSATLNVSYTEWT